MLKWSTNEQTIYRGKRECNHKMKWKEYIYKCKYEMNKLVKGMATTTASMLKVSRRTANKALVSLLHFFPSFVHIFCECSVALFTSFIIIVYTRFLSIQLAGLEWLNAKWNNVTDKHYQELMIGNVHIMWTNEWMTECLLRDKMEKNATVAVIVSVVTQPSLSWTLSLASCCC